MLYHYCSTETFRLIASGKSFWLSSLTSSNDALEGKWMVETIKRVAIQEGINQWDAAELAAMASLVEGVTDCLGLCMSTAGDTLSQWRGYADDGRGVSIGFDSEFLQRFEQPNGSIKLQAVVYDADEQSALVRPVIPEIKRLLSEGALRQPTVGTILTVKTPQQYEDEMAAFRAKNYQLFAVLSSLQPEWFTVKNPAFMEEKEVRLAMTVLRPWATEYRTLNGRMLAYLPVPFPTADEERPVIEQVILGPKNPTPLDVVEGFLDKYGYGDVSVVRSSASYR